ncbi:metal dependent amidohydrolase [Bimuria novae-zelandiae CBS 107.79]|uniref:Metal dependent amidohydrolase n=1 Tax=Bimuria novae-zelandiae CBS 107.79 TaxID=1447943 RepID=A0A6A5UVM0_9PLEO|nr:metal dependent amidohydrolase [Bimuria novae-zelandiae CBS 107.79]
MRNLRLVSLKLTVFLGAFAPNTHATCQGHSGLPSLYICGTILTPSGPIRNGHISIENGRIHSIGATCTLSPHADTTTFIDCGTGVVSPGFINAHEHLEFATVRPLLDDGTRVSHRHDWRRGMRGNEKREPARNYTKLVSAMWGELRHIFSGTTSVVGGAMAPGLVRNLDWAEGLGVGLVSGAAKYDIYPLDDKEGILRKDDCDYGPHTITKEQAAKYPMYIAHVSEGIDAEAANEFRCLSDASYDVTPLPNGGGTSTDIIQPNVAFVHALGLTEPDFDLVAERGAHLVWSPRTNIFLYGKTLDISVPLAKGVNVALGTDWVVSGSATMGREAVCAAHVMKNSFGVDVEAKTLWEMMTINAAKASGVAAHVGSLEVGNLADIVIFRDDGGDPYGSVVFGKPENINLVLRGGKVLVANPTLNQLSGEYCESVTFGEPSKKIVCVANELGKTYAEFKKDLEGVYPAILPGVPENEPSCEPTR